MGLDVYAGPVSRYVGGSWSTIIQQAGMGSGIPVVTLRPGESIDEQIKRALAATGGPQTSQSSVKPSAPPPLTEWQAAIMRSLGVQEQWVDDPEGEFLSDQPGWWGYGAVVLLAAYDEHPELAPGAKVKKLFGSRMVAAVAPDDFGHAEAFRAAAESPVRYPTLLRAEWCLPISGGPALFAAATPGGKQITMGHVDRLFEELTLLNRRTLKLSAADMEAARKAGPSETETFEGMAPFGLSVVMATAEFAATHRVAWIMDY